MQVPPAPEESIRYARCIEVSRRIRWETDRDVLRGRRFDFSTKFLPDGLSRIDRFGCRDARERRFLTQVQGRTYANVFGLVERFVNAKVLELSRRHWFGDQTALEALVRFSGEEMKHQEMFRRIDVLAGEGMPRGYEFVPDPNHVGRAVLAKSTWAVLALTWHVESSTQAHYRHSMDPDPELSELYKDVFLYHWRDESQHAIVDELEWRREHASIDTAQRAAAVDDFVALIGTLEDVLRRQATADAGYFAQNCGRGVSPDEQAAIADGLLGAYRWQHVLAGLGTTRFTEILRSLVTPTQWSRIEAALRPLG